MLNKKWKLVLPFLLLPTFLVLFTYQASQSYKFVPSFTPQVYGLKNCNCTRINTSSLTTGVDIGLCSPWSDARGRGQNVIAYSVYGDHENGKVLSFYRQIEDRIKEINSYYNGWIVRLYHNSSQGDDFVNNLICSLSCKYPNFDPCNVSSLPIPEEWIESSVNHLTEKNNILKETFINIGTELFQRFASLNLIRLDKRSVIAPSHKNGSSSLKIKSSINVPSLESGSNAFQEKRGSVHFGKILEGKLWRFLPMGDINVNTFLIRDVDSLILPREVAAVEEWIKNSTALVHAMRDHPSHNGVILAGMWGAARWRNKELISSFLKEMVRQPQRKLWNFDQILLHRIVWPKILDNILIHDSYHCLNPFLKPHTEIRPFPTRRRGKYFVSWGPYRSPTELQNIVPCPLECRPTDHLDWQFC